MKFVTPRRILLLKKEKIVSSNLVEISHSIIVCCVMHDFITEYNRYSIAIANYVIIIKYGISIGLLSLSLSDTRAVDTNYSVLSRI